MIDNKLFVENSPQLYNIGKQIADAYKTEIRNSNAVGSGELVQFKWDIKNNNKNLQLVYYLPKQWYWVEYGRNATKTKGDGSVVKHIEEWIKDKGIQSKPRYDKNGRIYTPTQKQLAYLITRKIHQRGYYDPNHHGKHLLKKSLETTTQLQDQFVDLVSKMVGEKVLMEVMVVLK